MTFEFCGGNGWPSWAPSKCWSEWWRPAHSRLSLANAIQPKLRSPARFRSSKSISAFASFVTPKGPEQVHVNGGFLANDLRSVGRLPKEIGYGIALLPLLEVFDDLQSGQLLRLLNGFPAPGIPVSLVYPSRRHLAPRTRVVMEFVLSQMQEVRSTLESRTRQAAPACAVAKD
jgi:hypothetical protein